MHQSSIGFKNLDPLIDLAAYRDIFEFPIQNYYQKAGFNFDKTPYEVLAGEYMKDYQEKVMIVSFLKMFMKH